MKAITRPALNPQLEADLTRRLVSAIAEEIWRLCAKNDRLDWAQAERHLQGIVDLARAEGGRTAAGRTERVASSARRPRRAGRVKGRIEGLHSAWTRIGPELDGVVCVQGAS